MQRVGLVEHKFTIIGNDQGRQRQTDNQSDKAQHIDPQGQGQEDDGGIQTHLVLHDGGDEHHVLDDLADDIGKDDPAEHYPETAARRRCRYQAQEGGNGYGNQLQIGDHIQQANKQAEGNRHGQADDVELDGKNHAHEERDCRLSAEVAAHGVGHVTEDA